MLRFWISPSRVGPAIWFCDNVPGSSPGSAMGHFIGKLFYRLEFLSFSHVLSCFVFGGDPCTLLTTDVESSPSSCIRVLIFSL